MTTNKYRLDYSRSEPRVLCEVRRGSLRNEKILIIILFMSLLLNSYRIGAILVSQYLLSLVVIVWLFARGARLSNTSWIFIISINLYFLLGMLLQIGEPWFSFKDSISSLINLNTLLIGFLVILSVSGEHRSLIKSLSVFSFYSIFLLEVIQFAAIRFHVAIPLPLANFWIGNKGLLLLSLHNFNRPVGIFAEPGWLAIMIFNLFFLIVLSTRVRHLDLVTFLIASALTLSLTALVTIFLGIVIVALESATANLRKVKLAIVIASIIIIPIVILIISLFAYLIPEFSYVLERSARALSGNDLSTNIRFSESQEVFYASLQRSPLFGAGIGNTKSYTANLGFYYEFGEGRVLNNFLHALSVGFGVPSIAVFFIFIFYFIFKYAKSKRSVLSFVCYIACHSLVSGLFVSSVFWIPLALGLLIGKEEKLRLE